MKTKQFDLSRRQFLKAGALSIGGALLAPAILNGRSSAAIADDATVVDENDALAKAMGYKKDATKVDVKAFPKRAAADGKTQFCNNCQFFTAIDKSKGKCQIFQSKVVVSKGWCNSWTKKA